MALDVTNQNLVLISKLFTTLGTSQSQRVSYIGEERCVTTLTKVTKVGYYYHSRIFVLDWTISQIS